MKKKQTLKPKAEFPDFTSEAALGFFSSEASTVIFGVDEVGRGCLAGPVIAAAVLLCPLKVREAGYPISGRRPSARKEALFQIRDSKRVPEEERETLATFLKSFVLGYAIGEASVSEINAINIYHASHLAMERAVALLEAKLARKADRVLVDGNRVPKALEAIGIPLVKGDNRSVSISSAALIAKVHRDQLMRELDQVYPGYGLAKHKGYGTPLHLAQIQALGATEIHRRDFNGVKGSLGDEFNESSVMAENLELPR